MKERGIEVGRVGAWHEAKARAAEVMEVACELAGHVRNWLDRAADRVLDRLEPARFAGPGQSELALARGREGRDQEPDLATRLRASLEAYRGREKVQDAPAPERERETPQEMAARLREAAKGIDRDARADRAAALGEDREAEEWQAELAAAREREEELERQREIGREAERAAERDRGPTAMLRKSAQSVTAPLPVILQQTASISALPRAEKRFMVAMRIWISAVWRSGSRDMILSPKSFRQFITASTRLRT